VLQDEGGRTVRCLLLLLLAVTPAFANSVECTGISSVDSSAIQASLNAGGTTTLVNAGHHCNLGIITLQTNANGTTLTTSTGVQIDYSGGGYAISMNHNNVTVSNIVWNGGGIQTTQTSLNVPQLGGVITGNEFKNIGNGTNGVESSGYWSGFNISNNKFSAISSVPIGAVTSSTDVENGGGYPCTYPGGCYGGGIHNENGIDSTKIENNMFDFILGDGIRIAYNHTVSSGTTYHQASNNSISYNRFTNVHRMAIESQGASGSCVGSCVYENLTNITGLKIAGNFAYAFLAPYRDTYAYSVPIGALAPLFINNTAVISVTGNPGYAVEDGNKNEIAQGNAISSSDSGTPWGVYFISSLPGTGLTLTHQNNYLAGGFSAGGVFFATEGPNFGGSIINKYNFTASDCQIPSACETSTLRLAFSTADHQSFPSRGQGVWSVFVTNEISIKNVRFFIDSSSMPSATQELQDVNPDFTADARWLYHDSFDTSTLADGQHMIRAVATDVSGATFSVTQSFTVGTGVVTKEQLTVNNGTGSGMYTAGATVTVTANAPASGYQFAGWTGATGALANAAAASTTLTMPAAAATITATYSPISTGGPPSLAVGTYNIEDANHNAMDGGFAHYSADTSVYLFGYNNGADQQFRFTSTGKLQNVGTGLYLYDSGGVLKQGASGDTFLITQPPGGTGYVIEDSNLFAISPNAVGPPNTLQLSTSPYVWTLVEIGSEIKEQLTVNNGTGSGMYTAGATVTVTANAPASGYQFAGWAGATGALANAAAASTTLTMPAAAATITATYSPISTGGPPSLAVGTYNIEDANHNAMDGGFAHYGADASVYLFGYNNGADQQFRFTSTGKLQNVGTGLYLYDSGGVLKQGASGDTFLITQPPGGTGYVIEDGNLFAISPNAVGPPNNLQLSTSPYVWTVTGTR
jgi:uncharacterized repeat protein (TIGR02543 family)